MPDLLLEFFSEEIPARMQRQAAQDLKRLVTNALVERELLYESARSFATPRRLTLHVVRLPTKQADYSEEKKGPRVGAPEQAVQGFLKAAGLARIEDAIVVNDPKKGNYYTARAHKTGQLTRDVIAEIIPAIIRDFPWPKSMRWGAASARADSLRWVRPLRAIVCTLADGAEPVEVVCFDVDGLAAGDVTFGHRFLAPQAIKVRRFEDYVESLAKAKVVLDADRRKAVILADAKHLAFAQGLELVEDEGLLEEVAGLVEWPVVLMGEFEKEFLDIPPEVIRATIRANQKCFVLRAPAPSSSWPGSSRPSTTSAGMAGTSPAMTEAGAAAPQLANKFILVSNLVASDGGKAIAAGNGRVVRARLADARHFWQTDLGDLPDYRDKGKPLDQRLAKLKALNIVFHEKLGTQGERVERIAALARELAPLVGADAEAAARAAKLAKADLVSEMVGEFPELQGLMGRYYAAAQGEAPEVAAAIEEHYKPQGPNDRIPTSPISIAVALADKLDTLVGFWAINEKPTGSKDPYALRRAALGVIRILVENAIHLRLNTHLNHTLERLQGSLERQRFPTFDSNRWTQALNDLTNFFGDRLRVYMRDRGMRHDHIDAVYVGALPDDAIQVVRRVEALGRFLDTEDGENLLAGYRRAANILKAEEKKDGAGAFARVHDPEMLMLPAERELAEALTRHGFEARLSMNGEDFEGAMRALSRLRAPVDAFFADVTVNADDAALRLNRLRLLGELREAVHAVADFSKISG